ncbi:MAG: hypothetical protein KY475_14805 [Planctomycetes bacterium]|nr:hypothetical protein [Planctomycetota bacterium]
MSIPLLLAELRRRGILLKADAHRLLYRPAEAMTPDLLERVQACKSVLLELLRGEIAVSDVERRSEAESHREVIDPPSPCAACGGLELWETVTGRWRCLRCDPPTTSRHIFALAERIRRQER